MKRCALSTCKACKTKYTPTYNTVQATCSWQCALALVVAKRERQEAKDKQAERRADKVRRDKFESRSQWLAEAQVAFNAWIRWRDRDLPCVSCGRMDVGQFQAGHYLSRRARPELRFVEDGCWRQCSQCNEHLSGNQIPYRAELVRRIGLARVEALEGPHPPLKLTIPEIQTLRDHYRAKLKEDKS